MYLKHDTSVCGCPVETNADIVLRSSSGSSHHCHAGYRGQQHLHLTQMKVLSGIGKFHLIYAAMHERIFKRYCLTKTDCI